MKYMYVTRVQNGPEQDPESSSWNWKAGVVHIGAFSEHQSLDLPRTLCGQQIIYNQVTSRGTVGGFQWSNDKSSDQMCPECVEKLGDQHITPGHAAIPDYKARRSWHNNYGR